MVVMLMKEDQELEKQQLHCAHCFNLEMFFYEFFSENAGKINFSLKFFLPEESQKLLYEQMHIHVHIFC